MVMHFRNKKDTDPRPFTPKSDWTPPLAKLPPEVPALIKLTTGFQLCKMRPNLSREEAAALNELTNYKNIIIKPADKGSAVRVMDRDQYLWEGHRSYKNDKNPSTRKQSNYEGYKKR